MGLNMITKKEIEKIVKRTVRQVLREQQENTWSIIDQGVKMVAQELGYSVEIEEVGEQYQEEGQAYYVFTSPEGDKFTLEYSILSNEVRFNIGGSECSCPAPCTAQTVAQAVEDCIGGRMVSNYGM